MSRFVSSLLLLALPGALPSALAAEAADAGRQVSEGWCVAGRHERLDGGVRIDWPGTEMTVRLKGRVLEGSFVTLDGGALLSVEADGLPPSNVELTGGVQVLRLATFKTPTEHTVVIRKATEANYSGPLEVRDFEVPEGRLLPCAPKYRHRLEWLGDSLSTGFGILSRSQRHCPNDFHLQDFTLATPSLVARRFNAELQAIVAGGWGLTRGWVVPHEQYQFHKLYTRRLYSDADEGTFDLAGFTPEVVVVSLGSNDVSMKVSFEDARDALVSLLRLVRTHRPGVPIVLVSTNTTADFVQGAAEALADPQLTLVPLNFLKPEGFACWHPTKATSQRWADELAVVLHDVAGW